MTISVICFPLVEEYFIVLPVIIAKTFEGIYFQSINHNLSGIKWVSNGTNSDHLRHKVFGKLFLSHNNTWSLIDDFNPLFYPYLFHNWETLPQGIKPTFFYHRRFRINFPEPPPLCLNMRTFPSPRCHLGL